VLAPLGAVQAEQTGKSILFMLETNPGPGLGLLLAFWVAGPKMLRGSVPSVAIIHFLGGIHEVYFPYVLMKPRTLIGVILGGMAGVFTNIALGNGLVATPSPGSVFAYMAVTPPGDQLKVLLAIAVSAVVSFFACAFLLRTQKHSEDIADLEEAKAASQAMKG
jgi:PTS system mannitol-specific IIC component